jgi:hypothetical protein
MPALYLSDDPTNAELLRLAKYRIGDRMRIVKASVTSTDPPDMQRAFNAALGRVLSIKEVSFWETGDPTCPCHISYEFHVAHLLGAPNRWSFLESIEMDKHEIKPVGGRSKTQLQLQTERLRRTDAPR